MYALAAGRARPRPDRQQARGAVRRPARHALPIALRHRRRLLRVQALDDPAGLLRVRRLRLRVLRVEPGGVGHCAYWLLRCARAAGAQRQRRHDERERQGQSRLLHGCASFFGASAGTAFAAVAAVASFDAPASSFPALRNRRRRARSRPGPRAQPPRAEPAGRGRPRRGPGSSARARPSDPAAPPRRTGRRRSPCRRAARRRSRGCSSPRPRCRPSGTRAPPGAGRPAPRRRSPCSCARGATAAPGAPPTRRR